MHFLVFYELYTGQEYAGSLNIILIIFTENNKNTNFGI